MTMMLFRVMRPLRVPGIAAGWAAVIAFMTAIAAHGGEGPSAAARQILDTTGVRGGQVVHLGCGDGTLTAALRAGDRYLVHGLDRDAANVERARATIREAGIYGPVAVDRLAGRVLPYTDNVVNLLVAEDLGDVPMAEVLRVLVPKGVAYAKGTDGWRKTVKPRPPELDDWTHYLHGPNGNAVSRDRAVDFLRQMQWIGGPRYGRHHDHMSSASAMVSANGRLFYIFDHGSPFSILIASKWQLVARDAFNGTVLWRRDMGPWFSQLQKLKMGPSNLPRRLVAVDDTVFVTLALDAPLTALDAATGETRKTYAGTNGTDEILFSDGVLFLAVNREGHRDEPAEVWRREKRTLMAVEADTGETLWEREWPWVAPGSTAVGAGRVVFFDGRRVVALDRNTGGELWQSEALGQGSPMPIWFAPCLVLYDDIVLFSGADSDATEYFRDNGKTMYALSAESGETLWKARHPASGYRSPEDVFVIDDLVWTSDVWGTRLKTPETGTVWGRDLRTGEVKVQFKPDVRTHWFHHRCHRAKATERYLLMSRTGIEFVDFRKRHWTCHHWARGACLYGIMPANGMVYCPPHPCACYLQAKLYGFNALAPHSASRQKVIEAADAAARLERGPAYDTSVDVLEPGEPDWPTFRADAARSGSVTATVPAALSAAWRTTIGGRLSSPVVAAGRLFVAAIDAHEVHALDAESGRPLWRFTAGGRVDSPPTIWEGRVLFGSADGHVYCLRADDGRLIWRYRAAPADLRMGAFGQIESVWPVHGSVLVSQAGRQQVELWCVAGRSMFLDGGMRLLRLDPVTGEKIAERILDDRWPGPGTEPQLDLQKAVYLLDMPVALPDVLSSDGTYVYMRSQPFDLEGNRVDVHINKRPKGGWALEKTAPLQRGDTAHLFSPTGLLDDAWWHRSYWLFGRAWWSGAAGYYEAGRVAPAGRPLVFDDDAIYGYGRKPQYYRWTSTMEYMLYACARQPEVVPLAPKNSELVGGNASRTTIRTTWSRDVPLLVRAMVLADETLFLAGPPRLFDETRVRTFKRDPDPETHQALARQAAALEGREGAVLWAVSSADGAKLAGLALEAMPVFDGMIAASGRIYYAATDGRIIALEGPATPAAADRRTEAKDDESKRNPYPSCQEKP